MKSSIYQELGYKNRREYLETLADEYGIEIEHVLAMAALLGPDEDFDGLVTMLEDALIG